MINRRRRDRFSPVAGTECPPGLHVDGVLDEFHRAIRHADVDATGMIACRRCRALGVDEKDPGQAGEWPRGVIARWAVRGPRVEIAVDDGVQGVAREPVTSAAISRVRLRRSGKVLASVDPRLGPRRPRIGATVRDRRAVEDHALKSLLLRVTLAGGTLVSPTSRSLNMAVFEVPSLIFAKETGPVLPSPGIPDQTLLETIVPV